MGANGLEQSDYKKRLLRNGYKKRLYRSNDTVFFISSIALKKQE
ncbi:hypothetical protein [Acinetobacter sp. P8-3-8]|nr:hypothetical protein [Acinetobacter sp. P8-3-8]